MAVSVGAGSSVDAGSSVGVAISVGAGSSVDAGSAVGVASSVGAGSPVGSLVGVSVEVWLADPWAPTMVAAESKLLKASNTARISNQATRFL